MNKYELFIKLDFNFIHWLNDEQNNYKGYKFWNHFAIKETKINSNGIIINFYNFQETGKPYIIYHYYNNNFDVNNIWKINEYDNFVQAWRYIAAPVQFASFAAAVDFILEFYTKKVNYLCGQFLS